MTRFQKFSAGLWLVAVVGSGLAAFFLCRCGGSEPESRTAATQAAFCEGKAAAAVLRSATCHEAQRAVNELVMTDPDCRATYPDGAPDVCALLRPKDAGE